jgi:hypothetical protein
VLSAESEAAHAVDPPQAFAPPKVQVVIEKSRSLFLRVGRSTLVALRCQAFFILFPLA